MGVSPDADSDDSFDTSMDARREALMAGGLSSGNDEEFWGVDVCPPVGERMMSSDEASEAAQAPPGSRRSSPWKAGLELPWGKPEGSRTISFSETPLLRSLAIDAVFLLLFLSDDFRGIRCESCGLSFSEPTPESAWPFPFPGLRFPFVCEEVEPLLPATLSSPSLDIRSFFFRLFKVPFLRGLMW